MVLLLAERALLGEYQCRIESLKTQYFIASQSMVQIMRIIDWALTSPSIRLQILYSHLKISTCNVSLITARILIKQKRKKQFKDIFPMM